MHALIDSKGKLDLKLISQQFGNRLQHDQFATEDYSQQLSSENVQILEAQELYRTERASYLAKYFGSLIRLTPLIIWGLHLPKEEFVEAIKLSHGLDKISKFPEDAVIAYSLAVRHLIIHDEDRRGAYVAAKSYSHGEEMFQFFKKIEGGEIPYDKKTTWQGRLGFGLETLTKDEEYNIFGRVDEIQRLIDGNLCSIICGAVGSTVVSIVGATLGVDKIEWAEYQIGKQYYPLQIYRFPFWKPKFDELLEIAPRKLVIV